MFDKIRQLTKETAIYGISTIFSRFLNFMLIPLYTNIFSTVEVGIYGNIYAYIAFFQIAFIYGMDAAYMKYGSLGSGDEHKKVFSTSYMFVFISSIFISLLLFAASGSVASFMDIPENFSGLINYVIIILFLDAIAVVPFTYLRLKRHPVKFAFIKTINICINLTLNLVLIVGFDYGIEAIFISNLAASLFSFVAVIPFTLKNLSFIFDKEILFRLLKFGIPYLPASLTSMMVRVIDRPILTKLTDDATVGVYTANYKLGIFMMLFVSMFQYAWQPFFLDNAKDENARGMFSKVLSIFLIASISIWVVLSLFIKDIISFEILGKTLIGQEFWGGVYIVPVILLGYIFNGMYVNFTAGIFIEEKTKYMPLITGLGAISNISLNLLLIPIIGVMGAAIAMLVSYVVMAAAIFIISQKYYQIKYEYGKIARLFLSMIIIGGVYYYLENLGIATFYYKIMLLFGYFILLFGLGILKFRDIKNSINLVTGKK